MNDFVPLDRINLIIEFVNGDNIFSHVSRVHLEDDVLESGAKGPFEQVQPLSKRPAAGLIYLTSHEMETPTSIKIDQTRVWPRRAFNEFTQVLDEKRMERSGFNWTMSNSREFKLSPMNKNRFPCIYVQEYNLRSGKNPNINDEILCHLYLVSHLIQRTWNRKKLMLAMTAHRQCCNDSLARGYGRWRYIWGWYHILSNFIMSVQKTRLDSTRHRYNVREY